MKSNNKNKTKVLARISDKTHQAITEEAKNFRSVDAFLWMLIQNWKIYNQK